MARRAHLHSDVLVGEPVHAKERCWKLVLRYGPIELDIDHRSRLVRSRRLRGGRKGTHGRSSGQNVLPILPV